MSDHEHECSHEHPGLTPEQNNQWHEAVERIGAVIEDVFGEEPVTMIFGAQFGNLGSGEEGVPNCIIATNLPPCLVGDAIVDMHEVAEEEHEKAHALAAARNENGPIIEHQGLDAVPEEVREAAIRFAESLGLPPESIQYLRVADTDDLDALPTTDEPGVPLGDFSGPPTPETPSTGGSGSGSVGGPEVIDGNG